MPRGEVPEGKQANMFKSAFIATVLLASISVADAGAWQCKIAEKQTCGPQEGCRPSPITITHYIDLDRKTYSRCDTKGCDTYDAQISQSGMFSNIAVPERGLMARVWSG